MTLEGGEYFNKDTKSWVKNGYWWYYTPEGEMDLKMYKYGQEVNNNKN